MNNDPNEARFAPFFVAQAAAAVVDNVARAAVIAWAAFGGRSPFGLPADVATLLAAATLVFPFVPLMGVSADLADTGDRPKLVRALAAAQVPLAAVCAVGMVAESPELLFLGLGLLGVRAALFGAVKYAFLADLVRDEQLVSASSLVQASTWIAVLVGGVLGVGVVGVPWLGGAIGPAEVALAIVVIAGLGAWAARATGSTPPCGVPRDRRSWLTSAVDAGRRTRGDPYVFRAILARAWFWAVGGVVVAELPGWTTSVLHAPAEIATVWQVILAAGIGVGAVLAHRLSRLRVELGLIPIGGVAVAAGFVALAALGSPWTASAAPIGIADLFARPGAWPLFIALFVAGLGGALYAGPLSAYVLWRAKPIDRARVVAGANAIDALQMASLTLLWGGLHLAGIGPLGTFALLGAATAVVALYVTTFVPDFLLRFLAWVVSNVLYRLEVSGLEHIPRDGPCVVVANHVTFIDWLIIGGAVTRPARFLMYAGYYKNPVGRFIMDQARVIPITSAKEDPRLLETAFDAVARELDDGNLVAIFPEGSLTANGAIDRFRPGIERILARNPVPVVPVALNGLWGSFFSRRDGPAMSRPPRRFWSRVWLAAAEPVPAAAATAATLESQVRAMWSRRPESP